MSPPRNVLRRGFTLVEILVVVAIIVILMAILVPVAMNAVSKARQARIALEISQLRTAIEKYKEATGDYPPSMGEDYSTVALVNQSICDRHLRRVFANKITPQSRAHFYQYIAPRMDQDEALVFWLMYIANDQREPFKNFFARDGAGNVLLDGMGNPTYIGATRNFSRNVYFEFDDRQLVDTDGDGLPACVAPYSKDTTYFYLDSRTYRLHMYIATAAPQSTQTVFAGLQDRPGLVQPYTNGNTFMNPTTFQIIAAGQDGEYGAIYNAINPTNGNFFPNFLKIFPADGNNAYGEGDLDNITDFSAGKTLEGNKP